MDNRRGSVLVVSLWMLVILGLLAAGLSYRMRLERRLTRYQWREITLVQIARAGASLVLESLEDKKQPPETFQDRPVMDGSFSLLPAVPGMDDEESRINLNTAPRETLERLFSASPGVTAAVMDWRDADDVPLPGGAESAYYEGLDVPYHCRNAAFESIEELLLVRGVTPDLFSNLRDRVTVYGGGRVNLNTATEEALKVLGMEGGLPQKIIRVRSKKSFADISTALETVREAEDLSSEERNSFSRLLQENRLTVQSENYRLTLLARFNGEAFLKRFTIVLSPGTKTLPFRAWREEF